MWLTSFNNGVNGVGVRTHKMRLSERGSFPFFPSLRRSSMAVGFVIAWRGDYTCLHDGYIATFINMANGTRVI